MKKEDLVALGLTEEQADKVIGVHAEELKGFIPKKRFDEVNDTKKDLEEQIADRDKQLKDLGDKVKGNEDAEKTIKQLQEDNQKVKDEYSAKIKDMTINSAIQSKLTDTKYPDLLTTKFDKAKLVANEDGTVSGVDEQLTTIKETYKDLFTPIVTGREPNNNGTLPTGTVNKESFLKMGYKERLKLKQDNEALYNKLSI